MAGAYATFAARGRFCPPNPIAEVIDSKGQQVLEEDVADTVNSVLRGVIDGPSRGRTGRAASIGRPAAGKTGSTNGSKAAWFVGYTPELATSVWVGKPVPVDLKRIRIGGTYFPQVYGGTLPAAIWQDAMSEAVRGMPVSSFAQPDRRDDRVPVPDVSGLPGDVARDQLVAEGFDVRAAGSVPAASIPAGAAAYTSPTAGSPVDPGATITLYLSNGQEPEAAAEPGAPTEPGTAPAAPTVEEPAPAEAAEPAEPAESEPQTTAVGREDGGPGNGRGGGNGAGRGNGGD